MQKEIQHDLELKPTYPVKDLYTVKEVSKFIGIAESDVRKLIVSGELRAIKFRSIKVPAIELERFLQNSTGRDFTGILG